MRAFERSDKQHGQMSTNSYPKNLAELCPLLSPGDIIQELQFLQQLWNGLTCPKGSCTVHDNVHPDGENPHEDGRQHHCPHTRDQAQQSQHDNACGQQLLRSQLLYFSLRYKTPLLALLTECSASECVLPHLARRVTYDSSNTQSL
jgi:hypothetical protein